MPKPPKRYDQHIIPVESIQQRIYLIRGYKVMLDADLADLLWDYHRTHERAGTTECGALPRRLHVSVGKRRDEPRFVEEALFVRGYATNKTLRLTDPLWPVKTDNNKGLPGT